MRIDRQDVDGVAVLTVAEPGEIDLARADAFRVTALEAVGDADRVVLDCSLVEFFDSAGMAALLAVERDVVERRRGRFVLACVNRAVQEVFRMVGFDSLVVWYPDVPHALAALRG